MNAHGISIETPWGDWVQLGHGPRFTILWERGENIGINIGSQWEPVGPCGTLAITSYINANVSV